MEETAERSLWIIIDYGAELSGLRGADMKVTIKDAVKVVSTVPGRAGKHDLLVSYEVEGNRFYLETLPFEKVTDAGGKPDPKKVTAEIKAIETERGRIIGQEFEV